MSKKADSLYERAKKCVGNKRCSVEELKKELRQQFRNRVKDIRSQLLDSHRNITNEIVVKQGYNELRLILLSDQNKYDLITPNDVMQALDEVEAEILQEEKDNEIREYEQFQEAETAAAIDLISCKVCEEVLNNENNYICDNCMQRHFSDV